METLLKQQLTQVAHRFQNGRLAMWLILFWSIALTAVLVAQFQGFRSDRILIIAAAISAIVFAIAVAAFALSRFSFRNVKWIASQVENRFPSLEQRLVTILDKPIDESNTASLFFRREILKETLDHAERHDWRDAMPTAWYNQLWFAQSVLCFLFLYSASLLVSTPSSDKGTINPFGSLESNTVLTVEPGNAKIEKGSNVVFTARFQGPVPADVALEYTPEGSTEKLSLPLRRNLKDPVFGGVMLGIEAPVSYRVTYNDTLSELYQIKIFEYPKVARSDAKIIAPPYSPAPEKLVEDTRRVTIAEGSELTWILHLNKPVAVCELADKEGNTHSLSAVPDKPATYSVSLTPKQSTTWKVNLVDSEGRKSKLPEELIAKVLPNKPPTIKLAKASDRRVSPLEEMELGAKLNDDFGISKVGLAYSINGDTPTEVLLSDSAETSKKLETNYLLALEQLKAKPDQLISYYFWAEDKDSDGQPRRIESDLFFAEVRPFEEIYREGQPQSESQQQQQQQQQPQQQGGAQEQAEEAAELQRQIIVAIWNVIRRETEEERTEKFDGDLQVIAESQASVIEKLATVSQAANAPDAEEIVAQIRGHMESVIKYLQEGREKKDVSPVKNARAAAQSAFAGLLQLRAREHEIVRSRQQQQQSQSQSQSQQNRQQQIDQLELNNQNNPYESQQKPPQTEQEQQAQEVRQAVNRLKELAQRQEDLNEELKKLQSELESAQTEEEKQNLQEQLDRLRDAQEELLRDADELNERLNEANENEAMEETREQMEKARDNVRQAAESLANKDPNEALSAGTRAEREFEQMRDELRQKSANQFSDQMQDMVNQAKELNEKQKQLNEQATANPNPENSGGLRAESPDSRLPQDLKDQSQKLTDLLDKMQQTVTEAETSEPLLADKLYDSFRETKQQNIEDNLKQLSQLAEQGVEVGRVPETQRFLEQSTQGIDRLQQQIESAAESVLGSEEESLRRALRELDSAAKDVNQELRNATGRGADPSEDEPATEDGMPNPEGNGNSPRENDSSNPRDENREPQSGRNGEAQPSEPTSGAPADQPGQANGQQRNDNPQEANSREGREQSPGEGQQPGQQPNPGEGQSGQPQSPSPNDSQGRSQGQRESQAEGQPPEGQAGRGERAPNQPDESTGQPGGRQNRRSGLESLFGGAEDIREGQNSAAPISGEDFLEFSDRLRDVEEMLDDPDLQSQVARIREAARDIRREARKHATTPQWSLVEKLVANPLREMRVKLQEELLRRTAEKNSLVPIDRDPVPTEFEKAQQKYYENLGSGKR
jgi:hypothetical protein